MQNEVAGPVVSCAISDGYPADSNPEVCTWAALLPLHPCAAAGAGAALYSCSPMRSCWRSAASYSCSPMRSCWRRCSLVHLQSHTQLLTQVQIRNMSILNQSRTVKDKVSKRGTNGHLWHSKAYTKCMSSACIGQCACNGATYFLMVLNAL